MPSCTDNRLLRRLSVGYLYRSKTASGVYARTNATYCNEDRKNHGYQYTGDVSEAACMEQCVCRVRPLALRCGLADILSAHYALGDLSM